MNRRNFHLIGVLYLLPVLVLSVDSTVPDFGCIEIGKYSSTGILNTNTGEYAQYPGLKTAWNTSPDGQYTLHLASTADSSDITIRSNIKKQVVMTVANIKPPIDLQEGRWSSDSHRVAFVSYYNVAGVSPESRVITVDIPTGTLSTHSFDKLVSNGFGAWSDDSAYLDLTLSRDLNNNVSYFLTAQGGNAVPFPVAWSEIRAQSWFPEGHLMIFVREASNQQELLFAEPEQGIVSSIDMPLRVLAPTIIFSPDRNYLAVYGYINCDQEGHNCDTGAVIFRRDGTSPQVVLGSVYGVPDWRAFWSGDDNVWLSLRPAQSAPNFMLSDAWEYNDLIAYHLAEGRSEVLQASVIVPNYAADIPGTSGGYSGITSAYFSPDGNRIFIVYENQGEIGVALADAEGKNRHLVVDNADKLAHYNGLTTSYPCTACQTTTISLSNPTWISSYLLMKWQTGQDTRITWIRPNGSDRHDLHNASNIEDIRPLPGDRYIIYNDTVSNGIALLDLQTGQHMLIYQLVGGKTTEIPPWYVVISPNHMWAVMVVGGIINRQYLVELKSFNVREIEMGAALLAGPTWSPDSQSIAFLQSEPDHISVQIISPTTEQSQVFSAGQADFWFPREFTYRERVMTWMDCP